MTDDDHKQKMKETKAAMRERLAKAKTRRGIIVLLSGDGKGKSSSAFGMLARALGHGQTAGVVQFLKGKWDSGEYRFFSEQPGVEYHAIGAGFTWDTQNKALDIQHAEQGWELAKAMLADPEKNLVILDELTYMFQYDYLQLEPVLEALANRPEHQNVIITGRGPVQPLIDISDTHSMVQNDKHAFEAGIKAQKGIEW